MRNSLTFKVIAPCALCCALATACSSGGGAVNTASTTGITTNDSYDTGIAGTVAAPAAATFGTAPAQLATPGGPSFDGSSGSFPANVTFPLILGGFQRTSTGLTPTPSDPAATATVINDSSTSSTLQVVIPSLGINGVITFDGDLTSTSNLAGGFSYVAVGSWAKSSSPTNPNDFLYNSGFVFGYQTPQAAMPTSGTAVFSGSGTATAVVYKTVGTEIRVTGVKGDASISANFASGAINGSLTQMLVSTASSGSNREPWNDVSVTGNIAAGSTTFNGSTAAASSPGTPMSLSGSAAGKINGAFFGPAAQQLGAVWSLGDGTGSALGTIVAGH